MSPHWLSAATMLSSWLSVEILGILGTVGGGARLCNGDCIDLVLDLLAFAVRDAAHGLDEEFYDVDIGRALSAAGKRSTKCVLKEIIPGKAVDPSEIARRFSQPNPLRIRESTDRGGDLVA